jgi:hypothetical protein
MSIPRQFILPFVARTEKRREPFSSEAEIATIFVLSEIERKNGKLTDKQETRDYISKIGYPLWFIVKENSTYIFDGLNRNSYDWTYYETAQIEEIIEDFEANFRIHEHYVKFLDKHQSFQQTQDNKKLTCEGLITDNKLIEEIDNYHREATEIYNEQTTGLLLPVLKETNAKQIVDQIETLQLAFKEKVEKIKQLPELISKTTKEFTESFDFESKAVTEEAEAKIKAQKEVINPKIEKITQEYKKQIELLEKSIDKKQDPLEKQKSNIEKIMEERKSNIKRYSNQAKIQAQRGNKHSEENLKQKIKREKQELNEHQKRHKKIEKQLKELTEQKTSETSKLKKEYDKKIQTERKPISLLETLREENQEFFKHESTKIAELTRIVREALDDYITQQEKILTSMKPSNLETGTKLKNNAVIYIPFYITAYSKTDSNPKRYFVCSPALATSLGFSAKLKGALGMTKIKDLFNERFKAISAFGEKLQSETSSDPEFEKQIEALTQKNNILNMQTPLKNGLRSLKEEGWLSETDYQTAVSAINT